MLAFVVVLIFGGVAQAGNGPHNWLVVYDPGDPHGAAIARHYQEARGFPEANLVAYTFPRRAVGAPTLHFQLTAAQGWALVQHLRSVMSARGLDGQIHGITLVGNAPNALQSTSKGLISINSALMVAPGAATQDAWEARFDLFHAVFRGPTNATTGVFQPTTEVRSDIGFGSGNLKYWLATHLGYTGVHGLRPDEVFTLIDRAVGADGTAPEGTVYWPLNFDVRSTTRENQAPYVEAEWKNLGLSYHIYGQSYGGGSFGVPENKTAPPGTFPHTERAVQGAVAGVWTFTLEDKPSLYTPGAIAEQVTSFGGVIGSTLRWSQSECTAWLRAGAAGTSGTVVEPTANWRKFPHARIHSHYFNGATLAEAFTQSVYHPYQLLVMGEPLCQPYAKVPTVTLSGVSPGQTLSGTVTLGATATGAAGVEPNLDLAVDGRILSSGFTRVTGGFEIDTSQLTDGWHELRAVAYAANAVRSQGFATVEVFVNNTGASVSLDAPATATFGTNFNVTATVANLPGVASVEIRSLGRVLATLGASGGTAAIPASALSYQGTNRLFAVAITSTGKEISSAPHEMTATWPPAPALAEQATIPGHIAVARVFNQSVTAPGFNWNTAVPVAVVPMKDRFHLTVEHSEQWPMMNYPVGKTGGVEFVTRFYARETGVYDFALEGWGAMGMAIDGVNLTGGAVGGTLVQTSAALEAGWHEVRIRAAFSTGSPTWLKPIEATFRAPYSRRLHFGGWTVQDFESFSLDHCAAPVSALDTPRLAGRATAAGGAALSWAGLPSATSWSVQRHTGQPAVSMVSYSGGNTAPAIVGPEHPDAMRPGTRTANDGESQFTLVPPWLQGGLRMITASADRSAGGSALIYRVQVPAWVTVYALVNHHSSLPAWMTAQGGWIKVSGWDLAPAEGLSVHATSPSTWQIWKKTIKQAGTLDLGGAAGTSATIAYDAISFVFIKDFHEPAYSLLSYSGTNAAPVIVGRDHANAMAVGAPCANNNANTFTALPPWLEGGSRMVASSADQVLGESALPYKVQVPAGTTVYALLNRSNNVRPAWMTTQGGWSLAASSGVTSTTSSAWRVWEKLITTPTALDLGLSAVGAEATTFVFNKDMRYWDEGWEQVGTAAGGATSATVSDLAAGAQTLRVVASGAPSLAVPSNAISLDVTGGQSNGAPAVDAGPDLQVAGTGVAVNLQGAATDDGLPASPGALSLVWSKISGPGDVTFGNTSAAATTATFGLPGDYVLQLLADDGGLQGSDTVSVSVTSAPGDNTAPVVDAGAGGSILITAKTTLVGSATDDGLPAPPARLDYRWRQVNGPGMVTFIDPRQAQTAVYFSQPGDYQLELGVSDGTLTGTDTVNFTIGANPNTPPVVDAGAGGEVFAMTPTPLVGTATDDGLPNPPGTLTYYWSQKSGPGTAQAVITDPAALSTSVSFPEVGDYVLELLVSDGVAASRDSVTFTAIQQSEGNTAPQSGLARTLEFANPGTFLVDLLVTDDGLPKPPGKVTATWEVLSGPGQTAAVAEYEGGKSLLAFDAPGTYQLELTLDDGLLQTVIPVVVTIADTHRYGNVFAWGYSGNNLGGPFREWISITPPAKIGWRWKQVAVGSSTSFALTEEGKVLACGSNFNLDLGVSDSFYSRIHYAEVPGLSDIIQIAHTGNGGVALKANGTVWTWGSNSSGQLGDNTTPNRAAPGQVPGLTGVTAIAAGSSTVLALKSDGTVWGWGSNANGQLGTGSTVSAQRTPVQMQGITNAVKIACPQSASIILLADGTLRACGSNVNGRLGDGTTTQRTSPVQVLTATSPATPLTGITDISAYGGSAHVLAIGAEGQVWAWGSNTFGKIGLPSTTTQSLVAVRVPYAADPSGFLSGIKKVAADTAASFALKENGDLLGWGYGYYHLWGTAGDFSTRYTPGPVINLPPLADVWAGNYTAFGIQGEATYETFAQAHFTPEEIDAGLADPGHDFLGVGRDNLLVYAMGGDPSDPAWTPPLGHRIEGGEFVFEAEYLVADPDLAVSFETSTNLVNWDPATPLSTVVTPLGDMEKTTLRFNLDPSDQRFFIRAKVTAP